MEQLFIPQAPPEDLDERTRDYLGRMFRDVAQNIETIADGRSIEKRHVAPPKPRDGMIVYADGTDWNPGSGEGFYERIAGAWVFRTDGAVLDTLFDANTILKADSDNTPIALTVPVQTLVGRITAGVITALTPSQVRTLINVEDGATADQTDAEIKTAYENNADTNEFSDAEQTKLAGIETGAEVSKLVQTVNSQDGAVSTGTTAMVFDDSIPQSTEGDQYMSVAITPGSTSNILEIDVVVFGAKNIGAGDMGVALFKDSDTGALAAGFVRLTNNNIGNMVTFRHRMTAPSTSAITFKVRAGANANTFTFNGINAGRIFGGVLASSISVKEYLP
jgi:hypothetical protein